MTAEAQTPAPGITFTKQDGEAALAVLASLDNPEYGLPTLTDEEIVALDGINHPQAVALPWLDTHRSQLELVCNVALRTLLSKGLVFPVSVNSETAPSRLGAIEPITGVMALRRLSQRVVITELTKSENEKVWLYTYCHDETALQELVDSSGTHAFSVCRVSDAARVIMELANAAGISSADGPAEVLTAEQFEAKATREFDDVRGVTIITAIGAEQDEADHYTLYTSSNALHGLEATEENGEMRLRVGQVSSDTALAKVGAIVLGTGA